jgi:hypothetical protein
MEGNKMSTEEIDTPRIEGGPWKISGKFKTFSEASNHKTTIMAEDGSLQVKIHQQASNTKPYYAVKSRMDPEIAEMVKEMEKKSKKVKKPRQKR